MSEEVTTASFEQCIEALSHVDRRRLLLSLLNGASGNDRTISLDRVSADATDQTPHLRMHHVHLPKLTSSGFVQTNRDGQSVSRGPRFDEIAPLLELLEENRERLPDDLV